jgi:Zn-dependent protease with chaperone function
MVLCRRGSRFCKWCGATLVVPAAPTEPAPMAAAVAAAVTAPVGTVQAAAALTPAVAPSIPTSTVAQAPATFVSAPTVPAPAPGTFAPPAYLAPVPVVCKVCGGNGAGLSSTDVICAGCGWLRPLVLGYQLDRSVFLWAQDGQAMQKLQSIPALHSVVRAASDRVGRPWIESTFNGIRLGPRQLPDVWKPAVLAARILGLASMPDVYVSGDQQWNTYTFGSDTSAFIVLGTAILNNFQHEELLFVLAREMGHCAAGHALWKTVTRFLTGGDGPHTGPLSGGILGAISPVKLLESAVDMPLMAWSRQSEITADRAGLLAVGDEGLARKVLLAWSIKSARLLKQVNIEEWMKQEDASNDTMTRLSEMTTSSSMYTTRRLRLLGQAAQEGGLMGWSQSVQSARKKMGPLGAPPSPRPAPGARSAAPSARAAAPAAGTGAAAPVAGAGPAAKPSPADSIRVVCNKCQAAMRVPFAVLRGKSSLNVRCPQCQNVLTLRPKPAASSPASADASTKSVAQPPAATAAEK